ncbi:MAG: branched-chain amino acid ABC transporter substrate-binding protein [Bradyrhizobium sp.]|uniref:branched-chain amino acid ABC transporter substrate-binding protein n=1 Tax=Bradyrhizobium sp. TaxID=376 RepID=UPI001E0F3A4F|nr:branched-chain amino acid ABC transporter substrate-binding protein [Bradyrhizobium sp.]MBV9565174.1 branched-chain amino acid ABC transporter substrate-binding protein [Bradyrhizobium sp.]
MRPFQLTRRALNAAAIAVAAIAAAGGFGAAFADQKVVKIGITLPFTGADAEDANLIKNGAMIAIDEANAQGGIAGYKIVPVVYDDGTATAGQYDPAQSATNTKKLISDPLVVANVGPQMSGSGKAMSPILSEAEMATITPSSTNPDITDPRMAAQFRPKGKAVYFRTVTTDAYQGPNMANYYKVKLNVKKVYILDDSGAYGVGLANAFEAQAKKIGLEVLGHDQLDPKEADYTTALTKIKALNPDALYYGGVAQAGVKLAKQAAETIPNMIKGGGDGVAGGSFLKGGGFPAIEGWYGTNAGPHLTESPAAAGFVKTFQEKYKSTPSDYAITAYDGAKVILAAVAEVAKSGKEMNRANVREAIQNSHVETLQGTVAFDQNGDILDRTVSVFQYRHDDKYPVDDITHQLKYLEAAPQS